MPWWGWLLFAWGVLVAPVGLLLGAVARKARERERALRRRQYGEEIHREWRDTAD